MTSVDAILALCATSSTGQTADHSPPAALSPAALCEGYAGLPELDGGQAGSPPAGTVWIEGGTFTMGDDDERPEERAAHEVTVEGFWIDRHEVTNAQFARFVAATGLLNLVDFSHRPAEPLWA